MNKLLSNHKILKALSDINEANDWYVKHNEELVEDFSTEQNPIITLVMCCDSRAHTTQFTYSPENNFFIIRNIGNQYILNQGCIEYGVRVLKTPVLVFLGHTGCGAIHAAMDNYSELPSSIVREIDHLALSVKTSDLQGDFKQRWASASLNNINQQVYLAMKDFKDLVANGEFAVIGMILDIDNSLQDGFGRINVINLNGNQNVDEIKDNPLVKDFFLPHVY